LLGERAKAFSRVSGDAQQGLGALARGRASLRGGDSVAVAVIGVVDIVAPWGRFPGSACVGGAYQ
jgi:hypothetical protein